MKHEDTLARQLVSFVAVGAFSAIFDWGTTLLLTMWWGQPYRELAKAFGWCIGTITAYILNSRFTFKEKVSAGKATAVFILYLSTFAIQLFIYWVTDGPLQSMGLHGAVKDTVSFVLAQGVATITNFILQRTVVFRDRGGVVVDAAPTAD